jgi:rhodanese-related sulfurtransferase
MMDQTVSPDVLKERLAYGNGIRLVDVRDYDEFAAAHVAGARCTPLPRLLEQASAWSTKDPLLVICHSGQRAKEAARTLGEVGFEQVSVVRGGTTACIEAGLPIVRGRKRIPIQRQVFIGAGAVILSGLTLGLVVPVLQLVAWLAAGSMIVAGVSGFCPMAKMLAVAPWNRQPSEPAAVGCAIEGACS